MLDVDPEFDVGINRGKMEAKTWLFSQLAVKLHDSGNASPRMHPDVKEKKYIKEQRSKNLRMVISLKSKLRAYLD